MEGVSFVRADLRGATFSGSRLKGSRFLGADISGADFRGARFLTGKMLLSAVWDPKRPPLLDAPFDTLRIFTERRRFEFDLAGAQFQAVDPKGVMGPVRADDRIARWGPTRVPRLGLRRLVHLLRERDYAQMMVVR